MKQLKFKNHLNVTVLDCYNHTGTVNLLIVFEHLYSTSHSIKSYRSTFIAITSSS